MISRNPIRAALAWLALLAVAGCGVEPQPEPAEDPVTTTRPRPEIYAEFDLTADLGYYTENQRRMIALLIEASQIMDELFWRQAFGDGHESWLASIPDAGARLFAEQNYGPWDRLDAERPFIEGVDPKPLGANFYPADMTVEEFEAAYLPGKTGLYSLIRRNDQGKLILVPYHVAYADELHAAAGLLRQAADLAESAQFATYLKLRANALISDNYKMSDLFWMDVKDNEVDVVIGPIETYEDRLFGYRAAYESYVLLKTSTGVLNLHASLTCCRGCRTDCRFPTSTSRRRRAATLNSMRTTSFTTLVTPTRARRLSRSTCPTTKTYNSRKEHAASS